MAKKPTSAISWLQTTAVRVTRIHFAYALLFLISIIIYDSSNLYTHQAIGELWTAGGLLAVANVVLWFCARLKSGNSWYYIGLVLALIIADIVFASYIVYWERGLYSKAVFLYLVPIISAAALRSRSILLGTTALSAAAYSIVSVRYFFDHYGLGYRVELWANVSFYSAMFFVMAFLLMVITRPSTEKF